MILVTASWCNPCQQLKQWLELTGNGEGVEILDVDVDEGIPAGIRTLPTLVVDSSIYVGNEQIRPFLSEVNSVEVDFTEEDLEL